MITRQNEIIPVLNEIVDNKIFFVIVLHDKMNHLEMSEFVFLVYKNMQFVLTLFINLMYSDIIVIIRYPESLLNPIKYPDKNFL